MGAVQLELGCYDVMVYIIFRPNSCVRYLLLYDESNPKALTA